VAARARSTEFSGSVGHGFSVMQKGVRQVAAGYMLKSRGFVVVWVTVECFGCVSEITRGCGEVGIWSKFVQVLLRAVGAGKRGSETGCTDRLRVLTYVCLDLGRWGSHGSVRLAMVLVGESCAQQPAALWGFRNRGFRRGR
jgi:hypothetical protein